MKILERVTIIWVQIERLLCNISDVIILTRCLYLLILYLLWWYLWSLCYTSRSSPLLLRHLDLIVLLNVTSGFNDGVREYLVVHSQGLLQLHHNPGWVPLISKWGLDAVWWSLLDLGLVVALGRGRLVQGWVVVWELGGLLVDQLYPFAFRLVTQRGVLATCVINTVLDVREVIFGDRIPTKCDIRRPLSANPLISGLSLQILCDRQFINLLLFLHPLLRLLLIQIYLRYLYKWVVILRFLDGQLRIDHVGLRLKVDRGAMILSLKGTPVLVSLLPPDRRAGDRVVVQG